MTTASSTTTNSEAEDLIDPNAGEQGQPTEQPDEIEPTVETDGQAEFRRYMESKRAAANGETPPAEDPPDRDDEGGEGDGAEGGDEGEEDQTKPDDRPARERTLDDPDDRKKRLEAMPEDARAEITQLEQQNAKLQQDIQSMQGRVAPMQRLVEDLRKQLRDKEEAINSPTLEDLDKSKEWKELQDELPDESDAVKKLFATQASALEQARQQNQQLQAQLAEIANNQTQTEWNRLRKRHPDADTVRSHPKFHAWLQKVQNDPQADPELIRKTQSALYEDVSDVFDAFKEDYFGSAPQPKADQQQVAQPRPEKEAPESAARPTQSRPAPPPPSPPSQGSGMSGARKPPRPMTEREAFRAHLKAKGRLKR